MVLIKSEVSFIYEGNDLTCGWRMWLRNFEIVLVLHSAELVEGLSSMLGWWTLGKLSKWIVLTLSMVSLLSVEYDNSSCFLNVFVALLTILECLTVVSVFGFW